MPVSAHHNVQGAEGKRERKKKEGEIERDKLFTLKKPNGRQLVSGQSLGGGR